MSSYLAMGANPACNVDPLGLQFHPAQSMPQGGILCAGVAYIEGQMVVFGAWAMGKLGEKSTSMEAVIDMLTGAENSRGNASVELWNSLLAEEATGWKSFAVAGSGRVGGASSNTTGDNGEDASKDGGGKGDKKDKKPTYVTPDLKGRPPTRREANLHYMYGKGEPLDVDLDKIDLLFLNPTDFDEKIGNSKAIQTLWSSDDGSVFGNIVLTLEAHNKVTSTYGFDEYDFGMHNWGNPINWVRNLVTIYGDPGKGTPFIIRFRGEGTISPLPTWRQKAYEFINQGTRFFTPNIPGQ